jgi:hypothetical protein
MSMVRDLRSHLTARRARRRAERGERALRRREANALRLANQRGDNNKATYLGGGGG